MHNASWGISLSLSGIGVTGAQQALGALPTVRNALARDTQQLTTGLRVNAPQDDPVAFVRSAQISTQISSRDASDKSLAQYSQALSLTAGYIQSAISIVQKIKGLTVQAASSLQSSSDLANIQQEITGLVRELNTISMRTNGDGIALFNPQAPYVPTLIDTQTTVAPTAGATSTVTFTLPQAPTAGNVLVVALGNGNGSGGGLPPPVITPPAGWVLQVNADNSLDNGLSIYTHVVAAGDPATYAFSFTPGDLESGTIAELSGVNTTAPFAASGIQETYPPATVSTPTIHSTEAGEIALGFHEINGYAHPGGTVSGAGWTEIGSVYQIYHPFESQISSLSTAAGQNLVSSYTFGPASAGPGESAIIVINPSTPTIQTLTSPATDGNGLDASVALSGVDPLTLGLSNIDVTAPSYTQSVNGTTVTVAAGTVLAQTAVDSALAYLANATAVQGSAALIAQNLEESNQFVNTIDEKRISDLTDTNVATVSTSYAQDTEHQNILIDLIRQANIHAADVFNMFNLSSNAQGQFFSSVA